MKTKNEFQGNKSFKTLQSKKFKNAMETFSGINVLLHEELLQIKGGDEVPGTVILHDLD
ncbi:MAG: hypothetical protein GQ564_04075 [Bacteroidales bacterium]|nr:hypothetical protein [Bacteroidales bacterium]